MATWKHRYVHVHHHGKFHWPAWSRPSSPLLRPSFMAHTAAHPGRLSHQRPHAWAQGMYTGLRLTLPLKVSPYPNSALHTLQTWLFLSCPDV